MLTLNKPQKLKKGDRVATVSLSWGGAGDENLRWRYDLGKRRLQEQFGLDVVEMSNTLKGTDDVYRHPEARAQDLMSAFEDSSIRAVFSCIGGDDSIRMLPYIDFDVIQRNPKIFIGYSDTTITHFMCLKAQVASVYGPSVLGELAEISGYSTTRPIGWKRRCFTPSLWGRFLPHRNGPESGWNGPSAMRASPRKCAGIRDMNGCRGKVWLSVR